jgi:oligoendopeptidase F
MKTTWNLELLYRSPKDPNIERDIERAKRKVNRFVKKWKENKRYLSSPIVLKEALDEYEELHATTGICNKPIYYFLLLNSLNQTDSEIKGRLNKISDIEMKLSNDIQFFELNIGRIPKIEQKKFLSSPHLKNYKHFLKSAFLSSKYLLTDNEEKVFNLTSKTSYTNWVNMVSELLDKQEVEVLNDKGEKTKVSYNSVIKYLNSQNKKHRDYASKKFNEVNSRYAEIAEFEINSVLERKKVSDEYRKVPRPDLLRHIGDDIESEIVDTVLDVVSKNFHISREYYKIKARLLKQKTLGYHERSLPLKGDYKEYSFKEGIELVEKTFKNLDEEFYNIVRDFKDSGQYDVFPKEAKSGGAYCINISKNLPTYILLNHKNILNDVLTIAHESGHGIHSEMSKNQNSLNSGYPTSLAEVASTFFEDFVLEEVLNNTREEEKRNIVMQKLDSDISSIFRQVAFYNFEKELHEEFRKKGYLNKEEISDIFCKHMKSYMGEYVDEDESMRNGWINWSHLRRFFYVYSYASGLLISKGLQSMVRERKENINLVKEFLSSGSTKSPKDLFRGIGIDIMDEGFWARGLNEVDKLLKFFK